MSIGFEEGSRLETERLLVKVLQMGQDKGVWYA